MNLTRRQAQSAMAALASGQDGAQPLLAAEAYTVTDLDPSDVEFVDTDWDGSEAEASYPNPSADDTDLDFLADHYLFQPDTLDPDDPPAKSEFKGPIRMGPGGPVNTNALLANIQAINGARGGFEGVSEATLSAGFDAAVDMLVAAGVYESADDAPEKMVEARQAQAKAHFDVGATVRWQDGDADVYGIIRDRAESGEDVFADEIDGDFALSPTEDNPGYLIETLDQTDDGWVPSGTMVGHRGETLEPWDPDAPVEAGRYDVVEATAGTVEFQVDGSGPTMNAADAGDSLTGIIWGAGDHDLALGGDPTPVRVPSETIRPTFEALKEDVAAGDVTLGFDHPAGDSVAAKTGIVDIGQAQGVGLAADEDHIVLTDSELTNDQAAEAAQAGDFDDLDWSVVADVAVRRDADGNPVREDGRIVLDATRIRRIDAVNTGAVDAASIERGTDPLPDLSEQTRMVQEAAGGAKQLTQAVQALRASAAAISDTDMGKYEFDPDPDDLEDARQQLSAAADIIDSQDDELEAAQAKADGFESLLEAHGVDQDDFEGPEAAAQAVIDQQTESTREEIAELEADLPKFDTDDVEARKEDLAGKSPDDLQNLLNARKATAFDVQQKKQEKGKAVASRDTTGRANLAGGSSNPDADADEIAEAAMDGRDRIEAQASGQSPAEYIQDTYGLDPSQYDSGAELNAEITDKIAGEN